ncbi:hypothetical protein [Amycolatopsis australiensis]|uniref:Uncharacterized protein n=1 Tax=Amycolatopsis australiensis TaxID=546364 RepID=A0A1K1SIM5_9PSEU|nr:hypothetical protein [Amycolatopsis australiensis]SFW83996.1 hypothetical protein SAMN04489730_5770 [Amycolatopsis australiensis]
MASPVRGPRSGDRRQEDRRALRLRHIAGCLSCTLTCQYCGLPVRLAGPAGHPGYGVVEEVIAGDGTAAPDLVLLHRFCRSALGRCRTRGCVLRRAHLGRATEQYETGRRPGRYQRLGVRRSPDPDLYRKHWRVAKMRYACKACRYYTGSH